VISRKIFLAIACFFSLVVYSQPLTVSGVVTQANTNEPIPLAQVRQLNTNNGTLTDEQGKFKLTLEENSPLSFIASYIGLNADTITLKPGKTYYEINLSGNTLEKQEVVVSGTLRESSRLASPIMVETYQAKLFAKNPSPNLFENMNMINGVQPQLNCNVCNTGDIHINGMEGPYTMILIDGMPIVSSLATVYGLMGIPQSLIKRVEVVKGPASTLYGSEAVAGLINVITKSPNESELLRADFMATSLGEFNLDVAGSFKLKKANSIVGVNYFNYLLPADINNDNFTDVTLQHRFSAFNKWNFVRQNNRLFSLAARYVWEDRWGGELQWNKSYRGTDIVYGETIQTNRAELFGVYQLPTDKAQLFMDYSYNFHRQRSHYGTTQYDADQHVAFAQLRFTRQFNKINLLAGLPFRFIYYDDNTTATETLNKNQPAITYLPGAFLQTEITASETFTVLAGMRYDYNQNHGSIFSPRLALKIAPHAQHVIRWSAGNGYRVVNLFTEDHAALSGARTVEIKEALRPEQSWNTNLNYSANLPHAKGFIQLEASGFFTYFSNRIIADYLTDPQKIIYDNLSGYALSAGGSLSLEAQFTNGLRLGVAATMMENYQVEKDSLQQTAKTPVLHAPRFSSTFSLSYTFHRIGLSVDLTGRINGPMFLPVVPNDFRPEKSPWFGLLNLKLSKTFKHGVELYAGVKNLLNFVPRHPILRPFDPFDKNIATDNPNSYTFDPSYNYAPIQGAKGFIGVSYMLSR
jgi:outer membrane receptor for ferrienterochelin and colicins